MNLMENIFQNLTHKGETLSVAESCTGGGLAQAITRPSGISSVFLGGLVAYSMEVKKNLLAISPEALKEGAVNENVALLMAQNCQKLFSSTWALSTTGIAGPSGGTINEPLGLVWIGLAGPNLLTARSFQFKHVSRLEHQKMTVEHALALLLSLL